MRPRERRTDRRNKLADRAAHGSGTRSDPRERQRPVDADERRPAVGRTSDTTATTRRRRNDGHAATGIRLPTDVGGLVRRQARRRTRLSGPQDPSG
ncbi:MAG TPA: hypothetical protein DCQ98_12800 [Planctomycetaceae bacterium]|nr:hypothetical protein [Planctomycetaceae bacterium]